MEIEKSSRNQISARRILSLQISFRFSRDNRWIAKLLYRNLESSQWWTVGRRLNERFAGSGSLELYHGSKVNVFTGQGSAAWGKINFSQLSDHGKVPKKYARGGVDRALTDFIGFGNARSYRWHEYFIGLFSGRFDPLCWLPAIGAIWLPGVN